MLSSIAKTAIIITILLLISQQAISGQLEDGFVAYKNGEVEVAQKKWLALAIKGDVRAQFFLSIYFDNQPETKKNIDNAKRWLTASANNGFVPAQFNLGNNFHKGKYGPANNKMAEYWWSQAAVQGFSDAQYNLATLYYWGKRGVNLDKKEAFYWFEQAAKGGYKDAVDAKLLMRGGETLPPPEVNGPANILYDDHRIVSKLSLDSKQMVVVNGHEKQNFAPSEQLEIAKPAVVPKTNSPEKAVINNSVVVKDMPDKWWISEQPAKNYTIQLLASTSLKECNGHLGEIHRRYRLETHVQSFIKGGRKYCAVVFGSYRRHSEAKAKLQLMPAKIIQDKPWIRKIAR